MMPDCVLSVRAFDTRDGFPDKPVNKLWNVWTAGVPPILGFETAFRDESQSPYDYIEVRNIEEVFEALRRLQQDLTYRRRVIAAGKNTCLN